MYSKRRRCPQGNAGANELREKYKEALENEDYEPPDCTGDKYTLLIWLIRCACLKRQPRPCRIPKSVHLRTNLADVVENINAARCCMTVQDLNGLESQVAAWCLEETLPTHVLTYLAFFFYRFRVMCRIWHMPDLQCSTQDIVSWLSVDAVERALVIPDVRKLAFTLFQRSELRPGEMEWAKSMGTMSVCSTESVIQILRTSEYVGSARGVLTYGSAAKIRENGLLPFVILAMVDIRLRSRAQLPWAEKCLKMSCELEHNLPPWPIIVVNESVFFCVFGHKQFSSSCMFEAVQAWFDVCINQMVAQLDGRWDISVLTI